MTLSLFKNLTIVMFAFFVVGCDSGDLSIKATEDLAAIQLDLTHFEAKNIGRIAMPLSGTLPRSIDTLEVSLDGGQTWKSLLLPADSIDRSDDCQAECKFTFAVTDLGARWTELQSMHAGDRRTLQLRGSGPFGRTPALNITIGKLGSGFRSLSAWSGGAEIARSLHPVGTTGFKVSSLQYEAEPRKGNAAGTFKFKGRVEE